MDNYTSNYTGEQIDAAVKRVGDIVVGTAVTRPAPYDGFAQASVENVGNRNPALKCFTSLRNGINAKKGFVVAVSSYNVTPVGDILHIALVGDGVKKGDVFTVDYLLI